MPAALPVRTLVLALSLCGLCACGQAGPLVLPDKSPPAAAPVPEQPVPADLEEKKEEQD